MATVLKQRQIIDIARLEVTLDARLGDKPLSRNVRAEIFALVKDALAAGRDEIRRRFEEDGASGEANVRATSYLMDQIFRFVLEATTTLVYPTANPTSGERICIAAVGGYGRGEMAPFSDIDLLFLLPYRLTPRVEQIVESVLYLLWDLGLKVGHATRSTDECIRLSREDVTIRTALLEARFLWGNKKLFNELRRRFTKEIVSDTGLDFVKAKLAERDRRHRKMGDSRYVLEPNIKDGKGGLRDLQTLFWIAKYLYRVDAVADLVEKGFLTAAEVKRFARAQNFLWTVRCHLHYIAGRPEERLTFDVQQELGERLGYKDHAGTRGVERFMKHYYLTAKEVGDLTRIFCAALESEHRYRPSFSFLGIDLFRREIDGFALESGRLSVKSGNEFIADPVRIIKLFHTAQKHDRDIHPKALRLITRHLRLVDSIRDDAEANRLFVEMLTAPKGAEIALRRMNEATIFGRFVPDFGRVVAQMQHDMYHVYTVDEHTIFAIGILLGVEQGAYRDDMPTASDIIHKIASRRALFVALFLHDIAKGRGGDHSQLGADVALQLCPRFGLSEEETETVAWLVRHHLLMSRIAFHRDLSEPKSIIDFAETVQSLERLRLLLLLTVSDIRAVGPNVWNNWKASLLRELYLATEAHLSGGHEATGREARIEGAKHAVREALATWPEGELEFFLGLGYPSYWLSLDTETHVRNARFIAGVEKSGAALAFDIHVDEVHDVTELTIYTADHPGLFSRIAGAMAVSGANVVGAKIFTMANGMALDSFSVQDSAGSAYANKQQLVRLKERIEKTLHGEFRPERELNKKSLIPSRTNIFTVAPRVLINNSASRTHSVIEINGRDRPGLLHDLTSAVTDLGLQISSALITTYGERAVDVFYVKDGFGMQVTHKGKIAQIRARLLEVLESGAASLEPAKEAVA
ncbi:MAG: [protein-PII] uridylyltransferase [Proteobacteria bacterium]|nr:[protein-PII] uridylyltransferase [Pseudomonadota bacterium]